MTETSDRIWWEDELEDLTPQYLSLLTLQYREKFGDGPPIFGYSDEQAIEGILKALRTGRRMPGVDKLIMKKTGLKPKDFDV